MEGFEMARSNMFANLENQFEFCDKEEITEKTLGAFAGLIDEISGQFDDQVMFMMLVLGAKLGVASKNGKLNSDEKDLVNETFGKIWNGNIEDVYNLVADEISDSDYDLVQKLTQLGNDIALPFLYLILGYAYIDEKVDDKVLGRLDGLFGMNLLALFMQSGLQEVPAPQIKLTSFEAEITKWFKSDDQLRPLNDIVAHFPGKSKAEVKAACDSLCDKGVLFGSDTAIGCMYCLA
jgi:hypothetical protein